MTTSTGTQSNKLYKQLDRALADLYCYEGWISSDEIKKRKDKIRELIEHIEGL